MGFRRRCRDRVRGGEGRGGVGEGFRIDARLEEVWCGFTEQNAIHFSLEWSKCFPGRGMCPYPLLRIVPLRHPNSLSEVYLLHTSTSTIDGLRRYTSGRGWKIKKEVNVGVFILIIVMCVKYLYSTESRIFYSGRIFHPAVADAAKAVFGTGFRV